jgi:hypothetical protein
VDERLSRAAGIRSQGASRYSIMCGVNAPMPSHPREQPQPATPPSVAGAAIPRAREASAEALLQAEVRARFRAASTSAFELSLVAPVYDERENIERL